MAPTAAPTEPPTAQPPAPPFAAGSVSLRCYPHNELPPPQIAAELAAQARLAAVSGFDGVMTSEHHGGFSGYLPNPLQVAGWMLEDMPSGWAAPCPLLLPLRPTAQVAEEVAWLNLRFPGRVGVGVAPGALEQDFEAMEVAFSDRMPLYRKRLPELVSLLRGAGEGVAAGDQAVRHCASVPVPVLSAAMSLPAVRRAARAGAGMILDSLSTPQHLRTLTDAYRQAGGTGTCVLIRRVWLGDPPARQMADQVGVYRTYSSEQAMAHWGEDETIRSGDPAELAARAVEVMDTAGADALNLRVHADGVPPGAVRDQIVALGDSVLPILRTGLRAE